MLFAVLDLFFGVLETFITVPRCSCKILSAASLSLTPVVIPVSLLLCGAMQQCLKISLLVLVCACLLLPFITTHLVTLSAKEGDPSHLPPTKQTNALRVHKLTQTTASNQSSTTTTTTATVADPTKQHNEQSDHQGGRVPESTSEDVEPSSSSHKNASNADYKKPLEVVYPPPNNNSSAAPMEQESHSPQTDKIEPENAPVQIALMNNDTVHERENKVVGSSNETSETQGKTFALNNTATDPNMERMQPNETTTENSTALIGSGRGTPTTTTTTTSLVSDNVPLMDNHTVNEPENSVASNSRNETQGNPVALDNNATEVPKGKQPNETTAENSTDNVEPRNTTQQNTSKADDGAPLEVLVHPGQNDSVVTVEQYSQERSKIEPENAPQQIAPLMNNSNNNVTPENSVAPNFPNETQGKLSSLDNNSTDPTTEVPNGKQPNGTTFENSTAPVSGGMTTSVASDNVEPRSKAQQNASIAADDSTPLEVLLHPGQNESLETVEQHVSYSQERSKPENASQQQIAGLMKNSNVTFYKPENRVAPNFPNETQGKLSSLDNNSTDPTTKVQNGKQPNRTTFETSTAPVSDGMTTSVASDNVEPRSKAQQNASIADDGAPPEVLLHPGQNKSLETVEQHASYSQERIKPENASQQQIARGYNDTVMDDKPQNGLISNFTNQTQGELVLENATDSNAETPQTDKGQQLNGTKNATVPVKKPRLLVAGPIRNAASHLERLRLVVSRLQEQFELVRMVFFENDSTDSTLDILKAWNESEPDLPPHSVVVVSEHNLTTVHTKTEKHKSRTAVLAYVRNRLWEEIAPLARREDYVLMMDMDDVNWHLARVHECLNLPERWSVCCANTYSIYYDLWALRTMNDWVDRDFMQMEDSERIARYRHIPASEPPIEVHSCFGGAALYKYEHLHNLNLSTYTGRDEAGNYTCEHVAFHASLKLQKPDLALYIQPKMLNNGPRAFRPRLKKKLKRYFLKSFEDPKLAEYYATRPCWDTGC